MGTIKSAQAAMGYTPANQRPSCHNCRRCQEKQATGSALRLWCDEGGFLVSAMATCDRYSPRPVRTGQETQP